jgi:ketosteroid isomerase-like protein
VNDYKDGVSQENVDQLLRIYEAFGRRDNESVFAEYDPDVEWNMEGYLNWPGKRSYRGVEGVREFFSDWLRDFDDFQADALDPLDLGDRVLFTVHDRASGKGSGVPIERYHAQVWTFRDGKVVKIEVFDSRESALAVHPPPGGAEE